VDAVGVVEPEVDGEDTPLISTILISGVASGVTGGVGGAGGLSPPNKVWNQIIVSRTPFLTGVKTIGSN
jgi:hypothetical protein